MTRSFLIGAGLGAVVLTAPQLVQAAQAGLVGRPAATQTVDFTVTLPLRNAAQLDQLIQMQSDRHSPLFHHFLSVAQFRANYAPAPQTMALATASLRARAFAITGRTSQSLRVRGTAASVENAFRAKLGIVRDSAGTRVASTAPLTVPAELTALGVTLTGFERRVRMHVNARPVPLNRRGPAGGYYFDDLKQAYTYPSDSVLDGTGATVGVLMSSDVLDSDTNAELEHEKYSAISGKTPLPLIRRPVFGGAPFRGVNSGVSDEASIDVQTSQGSAPGAQIVLYNIPSLNDDAVIAGYTDVVEDNKVDVLSSSFGGCELFYTAPYLNGVDNIGYLKALHALYQQGNAQGITFLASSGDSAGLGCITPSYLVNSLDARFIPGVEEPASDPNVTAVGGTNLETTAPPSPQPKPPILRSKYVSEDAYGNPEIPYDPYSLGSNVSGGYWGSGSGTSAIFAKPWYQNLVNTGSGRGRSVPDISMQMGGCPGVAITCSNRESFSIYYIGGTQYGFIGTSLSSPEFAGLLALGVQAGKSRLGNVNGYIYQLAAANDSLPPSFPTRFFHQGIPGDNGVVKVPAGTRGYNPIVGVGTPYAQNDIGISQLPIAGDPQTLSNP